MLENLENQDSLPTRTKHKPRDQEMSGTTQQRDSSKISARQIDVQHPSNIFLLSNVFSPDECRQLIARSIKEGYKGVPPTGGRNLSWCGVDATEVRINERVTITDQEVSKEIWKRIRNWIPRDLGFRAENTNMTWEYIDSKTKGKEWTVHGVNDRLRFVKYEKGDQFLRHMDGTYVREVVTLQSDKSLSAYREQSFLSLILYLNDDFEGGETVFYDSFSKEETMSVTPRTGSVLVMLHENLHEGSQVTRGAKYILRTDVLYRKSLPDVNNVLAKNNQTERKLEKAWKQGQKEVEFPWQKIYHPSCKHYTD